MKRTEVSVLCSILGFVVALAVAGALVAAVPAVEEMLQDFVDDYRQSDDLPAEPMTFGLEITGDSGGRWSVAIDSDAEDKVTLERGFPVTPTFYAVTDTETLGKIYRGEMNALTAAGRARMTDKTPLDFGFMEGFVPDAETMNKLTNLGFHFFNRGKPEIVRFGESNSRLVHGGNSVIFYYQKGLRTAWYQVKKGMIINENLEDARNPFATLFIITKGAGKDRLGDDTVDLEEGMTILVPAEMIHQFWGRGARDFSSRDFSSPAPPPLAKRSRRWRQPLLDVAEGAEALDGFGVELGRPGTAQQLALLEELGALCLESLAIVLDQVGSRRVDRPLAERILDQVVHNHGLAAAIVTL
jgi:mannose-6-phosphate isomerase-like protein (cupin superfamily)